nr:reverse transcriptase domain-containing protein [Tanacetum cinerariifolium]
MERTFLPWMFIVSISIPVDQLKKRIRLKRDKSEQNRIKTRQKWEAWRSPKESRVVSVDRQCNPLGSGISFLLAVETFFTGSGNFFCQWELLMQRSSALASLCIDSGNFSSIAVGSCFGSGNSSLPELYNNHRIQLLPIERNAHVEDIVESKTAIAQTFLFFFFSSLAVQTSDSGISILLIVAFIFRQWEVPSGSGNFLTNSRNALCILFPTAARIWLEKEPPRSILTWDDLVSKFINQFFPLSKTKNIHNEITRFQQRFDESFYEAWDRFNDLLRACPHHGFSELH